MRKSLRFYIALWGAKAGNVLLKILKRNASYFPGKFAVSVCPDFIGMIDKPETIIAVTGTNGKTTTTALTGEIMTMPGLPKVPAAERIDVDDEGRITGLF